jgi:L-threonylcarbamoyladenylate synthase
VGLRWPSHPFIQAVIKECGFPLAAPSANLANRVSPTTAEHVRKSLGDKIPLIVDGGASQVGIESTVLDISVCPPHLLRPGMIQEQALLAVIDEVQMGVSDNRSVLKSPGRLPKHYSPQARLVIWSWVDEASLKTQAAMTGIPLHKVWIIAHTRIPAQHEFGAVLIIPHDAQAFARAIYAALHESDHAGAELIIVEVLPDSDEWRAVGDRLRRAAS